MFFLLIFLKFPRASCSTEKEMQFHPSFWYSNIIGGGSRSNVGTFKHDVLSETNGNGARGPGSCGTSYSGEFILNSAKNVDSYLGDQIIIVR